MKPFYKQESTNWIASKTYESGGTRQKLIENHLQKEK